MFTMITAFSQFERVIIQERVKECLEKARIKGKVLDRPKAKINIDRIKNLRNKGLSVRKIAL